VMNETAKEVVQETVTVVSSASAHKTRNRAQAMSYVYGASVAVLACCTLFLGWQLYLNKDVTTETKTDLATLCAVDETATAATATTVATTEPMVEPISVPATENVPESAFAPIQNELTPTFASTESAPSVAQSVESTQVADSEIPSFNPNLGAEMQAAPVNPVVGSAVALPEENYPSFNANLAGTATVTNIPSTRNVSNAPIYAQNPNPTANMNQYVADANANWNAGATMDEIPTFNSEISNFNARPTQNAPTYAAAPMPTQIQAVPTGYAPEVAPMAPQVGTQAHVPAAPRKLSAPNNSMNADMNTGANMNTIPTTAPMAPQANYAPAEETYPSFNPNMGVDNSLPVSYY
ncbi:MAG: hypothetical protein Q4C70_11345, partial [Planctomycetia bacterium]|nr:hypothetical protein [Planctomycetia bacterium]